MPDGAGARRPPVARATGPARWLAAAVLAVAMPGLAACGPALGFAGKGIPFRSARGASGSSGSAGGARKAAANGENTSGAAPVPVGSYEAAGPSPSSSAFGTAAASGAWLRLSPDSGPPGTLVTLTGYLPADAATPPSGPAAESGVVCWDGCAAGLNISPTWHWTGLATSPTVSAAVPPPAAVPLFKTTFTVPAIPWLTAAGPHPLTPGAYAVGIRCAGRVAPGCILRGPEASATFYLTGSGAVQPLECAAGAACARLAVEPAAAALGTKVAVTGWAPLTSGGYHLVLSPGTIAVADVSQDASGALTATFAVPDSVDDNQVIAPGPHTLSLEYTFGGGGQPSHTVTVSQATLTVKPASTWASLGMLHPLWVAASQPVDAAVVRGASAASGPVAVCARGTGIRWTADGGRTWTDVPTAAAVPVAAGTKYVFQLGSSAQVPASACASVLPDSRHPGSFYATFDLVAAACDCAPPYIAVGYVTTDQGAHWRPVPPPPGFTEGDFGGFQVRGDAVQALFSNGELLRAGQAPHMAVVQSTDGGVTWTAAPLGCPASGPCVRLGARPSNISTCMAEIVRTLFSSSDGGSGWRALRTIDECSGAGATDVAAVGPSALLLLRAELPASGGQAPLMAAQVSHDGGATWTVVAIPPLPEAAAAYHGAGIRSATFLPDGAIAAPDGTALELLAPGAATWCPAAGVTLPRGAGGFTVAGGSYWWTTVAPAAVELVQPGSVPLSALRCAS